MKKITTIASVAIFAIAIISCSKSSYSDLASQAASRPADQPKPEVTTISNWLSPLSFTVETDRLGDKYIKANCLFTPSTPISSSTQISYDKSTHIELAYVKMPSDQRFLYKYKKLPFDFEVVDHNVSGDVRIDFSLDPDGLKIYFKNADYSFLSRAVDQSIADKWNFRYIVIPKTKYQSTNVDWNDLIAVAAALNFSL